MSDKVKEAIELLKEFELASYRRSLLDTEAKYKHKKCREAIKYLDKILAKLKQEIATLKERRKERELERICEKRELMLDITYYPSQKLWSILTHDKDKRTLLEYGKTKPEAIEKALDKLRKLEGK